MTLGELIQTEKFQDALEKRIKEYFGAYDTAVSKLNGNPKRNPMMRLREMGAEKRKTMTRLYVDIIDHKSDLPAELRTYVKSICEPVLNKCLIDYVKELKGKEAEDGKEA